MVDSQVQPDNHKASFGTGGLTFARISNQGRTSLANPSPEGRAESRIPKRILVRLWNLENDGFEITPTVDISSHGAQVVSRLVWQPNEQLLVQSIRGNLYSRARVAHYRSLTYDSYMVGLHLHHPTQDWKTSVNLQNLSRTADTSLQLQSVNPHEVLTELCALLEEYAPTWYTEKQRDRALAAQRLPTEVLLELVALLEEYAPTWYTEKQRDRALAALRALGLLD